MKDLTVRFDDRLLEAGRRKAVREQTTLQELFRKWLEDYAGDERQDEDPEERKRRVERAMATIDELRKSIKTGGRKFTRDEMNER